MTTLFNQAKLEEAVTKSVTQNAFGVLTPEGPSITNVAYHTIAGVTQIASGSKKEGICNIATGALLGTMKLTQNEKIRSVLAIGVGVTSTAASVASIKKNGLVKHIGIQTAGALLCYSINTINNYNDLMNESK